MAAWVRLGRRALQAPRVRLVRQEKTERQSSARPAQPALAPRAQPARPARAAQAEVQVPRDRLDLPEPKVKLAPPAALALQDHRESVARRVQPDRQVHRVRLVRRGPQARRKSALRGRLDLPALKGRLVPRVQPALQEPAPLARRVVPARPEFKEPPARRAQRVPLALPERLAPRVAPDLPVFKAQQDLRVQVELLAQQEVLAGLEYKERRVRRGQPAPLARREPRVPPAPLAREPQAQLDLRDLPVFKEPQVPRARVVLSVQLVVPDPPVFKERPDQQEVLVRLVT